MRTSAWSLLSLVPLVTAAAVSGSGPPPARNVELFADVDRSMEANGSGSESWIQAGGLLYFLRFRDGKSSLWRTDGSAGGTSIVRDLDATSVSTRLRGGEMPDGRLIFAAADPALGREPWVSDGTTGGTRLFADLCPGPCNSYPGGLAPFGPGGTVGFVRLGDDVVFSATVERFQPTHLFAVDGAGAMRQVSERDVDRWVVTGGRVFVLELADRQRTLWVSDGTVGSEDEVQTLAVDFVYSFLPLESRVLLVAESSESDRLELYAGNDRGLERIAILGGGAEYREAVSDSGLAYVMLDDRLIRTDGTSPGTFELLEVDGRGRLRGFLEKVGRRAFFVVATPAFGSELWTTDGTREGTVRLREFAPGDEGPSRLTAFGSELLFFAEGASGPALWRSDGSLAGTAEIRSFREVDGDAFVLTALGVLDDRLYFAADAQDTGLELWSSDGTPAGTGLVANLWQDVGSSDPRSLLGRDGDLVFVTDSDDGGSELFRATHDGFVERSFTSGRRASVLGEAGSRVVFTTAGDPLLGPEHVHVLDPETGDAQEVLTAPWVLNAATLGERLLLVTGRRFSSAGLRIVDDLWVTGGSPETTARLATMGDGSFATPDNLLLWRGHVYFAAHTDPAGTELWRTDGTREGTRLALDLVPGREGSSPSVLAASSDALYLLARLDGQPHLVITGGPGTGTRKIPLTADIGKAVAVGGRLLWVPPQDPTAIWTSDGSIAGTGPLRAFDRVGPLTTSGPRVFFPATTRGHGSELWTTDGTAGGTRRVLDVVPGPESSDPAELEDFGGFLVFSARTAAEGREPWVTDGTPEGTRLLADLEPGPEGSVPEDFTPSGDRVLFVARRGDVGRELFAMPRSALASPCMPGERTLCLNSGRFRVGVEWRDFEGKRGSGRVVPHESDDSGLFYFFDRDNWEMLVKVLDGCGFNDRFWVFSAATTNVEYTLRVTDTERGVFQDYFNPLGTSAAAITDVETFATCP